MTSVVRSIAVLAAMFVAPPALLFLAAHFTGLLQGASAYAVLFVAGLTGVIAICFSNWSRVTRLAVVAGYIALAIATLPFLTLLAVCSTGNCL